MQTNTLPPGTVVKSTSKPMPARRRPRRVRSAAAEAAEEADIKAAVAGDQKAFSKLYYQYYGQVYAFCMRMLNGRSDVEDAVQQVFLECWRSLYRFEGRSMFSTWLIKIAIHTCLSVYRKTSRTVLSNENDLAVSEKKEDALWANNPQTPDEHYFSLSKKNAISHIVNRMTVKKKTVFILSDIQGMTAPEISGILGIPDATVRTRLFHARREFHSSVSKNPAYKDLLANGKTPVRRSFRAKS